MSRNLQGEEWGNISHQELANLVHSMRRRCTAVLNAAGGHTRYLWFWPPFVQGHIIQFLLVTCLWNLFSLCLSCWILCSYKYLHMFAENKHSWQWEDISFFAEFTFCVTQTVFLFTKCARYIYNPWYTRMYPYSLGAFIGISSSALHLSVSEDRKHHKRNRLHYTQIRQPWILCCYISVLSFSH